MALLVQNKSEQTVELVFRSGKSVLVYSRKSVQIDDADLTAQIKNLEEKRILKVTRI